MTTPVPLLDAERINRLPDRAREVVEYRKSGLKSDAEAVDELVGHRYFQPHVTPIQLFNRATEPFLPKVRPHTFAVTPQA